MHQQYIPSQALVKDQLNQIRLLTSELQAKESETSLLKDELTRLSEICYNNEKNAEMLESRYKFLLEENDMKTAVLLEEISSLKQQKQSLKSQSLDFQQQILAYSREMQKLEDNLENEMKEKQEFQQEIINIKEELYRWELENEHLTAKLAQKSEVLMKLEKEIGGLRGFNMDLSNEVTKLQEEIKRSSLEISEKNSIIGSLKNSMKDYNQLAEDYERILGEYENNKMLYDEAQGKIQEMNYELENQSQMLEIAKNNFEKEQNDFSKVVALEKEKVIEKDKEIMALTTRISNEIEQKKLFDSDFKSIILLLDSKKGKGVPVFDLKSENLHLSVIKAKIIEVLTEKDRILKQSKKLTKNQQFLLDDIKSIQEKLLVLNSQATNQESESFQNMKVQYEEKLNEIDKAYIDKEARLEFAMKSKEREMAQMADLLNDHVSLIKQKEQEKMELLGLITTPNNPPIMQTQIPYSPINNQQDNNYNNHNNNNIHNNNIHNNEQNEIIDKKVDIDICEFTNVISILLQIVSFANDKYKDLLMMKRAYRGMLEYYLNINSALRESDNINEFPQKKSMKRFRKIGYCVLFCEILGKMWSITNLKNMKNSYKIEFRNYNDSLLSLLPRVFRINDGYEERVRELFNQKIEIGLIVNEGIRLLANVSTISTRRTNSNMGINPGLINNDLKRLKTTMFNKRNNEYNKPINTVLLNLNKENENKLILLGEENEYLKGKLNDLDGKMEIFKMENENMKHLLDDSENKRSILIQNFKELEKHAQVLNSENQMIKSGGSNNNIGE